jgi:chitin synthase
MNNYPQQPSPYQQNRGSREYLNQPSRQQQPQRMPTQGRPMRPPGQPQFPSMNAGPMGGQGPYQRVNMNRAKSLSRPERQRPKTGMIRSPSQQQRMQQQQRYNSMQQQRPRPNNYPMPNRLQQQLQQQKMQQQNAILNQNPPPPPPPEKEPEEKIKVLTNWWAWIAFLMTCCIPNWFLRVCLRKRNALVQQAWREKVNEKKKNYTTFLICCIAFFVLFDFPSLCCSCLYHLRLK